MYEDDYYDEGVRLMGDDSTPTATSTTQPTTRSSPSSTASGLLDSNDSTTSNFPTPPTPNIHVEAYVPYTTAVPVLGIMALVIVAALCLCSFMILVVRYNVKKEGKKKIFEKRVALEKSRARTANRIPVSNSSPYVMTADQKLKQSQQQQAVGPQPVETQARDLAAVLSYLAANPVEDEDVEFRPSHRKVLLVPQRHGNAS